MELEEAFEVLRTMEDDFENWYTLDDDEDESYMSYYKDMFSRTKFALELGEYTEGDYNYLKGLLTILVMNEEHTDYYDAIATFCYALSDEYDDLF